MPAKSLSTRTLAEVPAHVGSPGYDRARLLPGIVHLGLGAFYRAHGAAYTDGVLSDACPDWGIIGVSLQRPDQRDRLAPQDYLYTMLERDGTSSRARIIGSVLDVIVAPEGPDAVVSRLAAPTTRVVTLTITEKGYCHDPASGRLNATHPDIRHDLGHPDKPRTALGFLVAALARRRVAGHAPPTIVCCDNLPHNGRLLMCLVRDFAAMRDDALAAWIERTVAFPSSMVDRIVPALTDADLATVTAVTGLADRAPVVHEPFAQWALEDIFVDDSRPRWERVGVELVSDVAPYEAMKLQMINGAHSALAYLGYLGGHETIADCMGDARYRAFAARLWRDEIMSVTAAPPGVDLAQYAASLETRFANTAIRHRTWQIAMDGSQKLPQRLLKSIERRVAQGGPIPLLATAVAAWMRYVGGVDDAGRTIDVRDPLSVRLAGLSRGHDTHRARVKALLAVTEIFSPQLARNPTFEAAVLRAYQSLATQGARATLDALAAA